MSAFGGLAGEHHQRAKRDGRRMSAARPPFDVVPGQSAHAAAAEIVAVCQAVGGRADKLQWVERETSRRFDGAADPAMRAASRASRAIAKAVDADAARVDRHAYHNRQHFCEVMLVACFLGRLHCLSPAEAQRLLLAALVHDLDHEGRPGDDDFRAERRSLEKAAPFLREAGVDAAECRRIAALVLATAPAASRPTAPGTTSTAAPALAPELDELHRDASLARHAVLLREADLLPSVGLTPAHGRALQGRLADEWQRPLGRDDKCRFIDGVLATGAVGDFFVPNVHAFRARLAASDDDGSTRR